MHALNVASAPSATLPRLTVNQAQALSLIALHGEDIAVTLPPLEGDDALTGSWRIRLTYGAPQALGQAASLRTDLDWAGAAVRLHLPPAALSAWIDTRLPDLSSAQLPPALQAAALETLLAEAVNALAAVSSGGPPRVKPESGSVPLAHVWTLAIRAQVSGHTVLAMLEMDELGLMLLAGLLSKVPVSANSEVDAESMVLRLRAEIGAAKLPASGLRVLAPGDVILLDEYLVGAQGEFWLSLPTGQGVRVRAEQSSYLVTQSWTTLMTENPTLTEDVSDSEPLNVDAIPVRLTFDLGDRNMTLAEVRSLQPGVIFNLQRPLADGAVMIRVNGALVGSGALVEIDGQVGVCIATLGKSSL